MEKITLLEELNTNIKLFSELKRINGKPLQMKPESFFVKNEQITTNLQNLNHLENLTATILKFMPQYEGKPDQPNMIFPPVSTGYNHASMRKPAFPPKRDPKCRPQTPGEMRGGYVKGNPTGAFTPGTNWNSTMSRFTSYDKDKPKMRISQPRSKSPVNITPQKMESKSQVDFELVKKWKEKKKFDMLLSRTMKMAKPHQEELFGKEYSGLYESKRPNSRQTRKFS